jgi:ABC-2 type transport system ATP-binding protein
VYHERVLVELTEVKKRYGRLEALRGLTGGIDGERIGLLGPNGAGKSTLIKLLLGLTPFEGEARVLGRSARREPFAIRDRVGYMPETESHLAAMTAVELCVYASELSGLPRGAALQRAHAALYHVGLEDKRYLKVETYSTGLKQRVKLAQALVHDPELLFLDEPTNGLDPAGRDEMLDLVARLPEQRGARVLLSTHLLPDVERVCDRVVVMSEGRLVFVGSVDELRGADRRRFEVRVKDGVDRLAERLRAVGLTVELMAESHVGLGPALSVRLGDGQDTGVVFDAAAAAGVQVRHLAPQRATLEEAFLRAVQK